MSPRERSTATSRTCPPSWTRSKPAYTKPGVSTDRLDGLTVNLGDGCWFNLRPSNTEPLLRLNVEAPSQATMAAIRDEALALVRR
jgi:phosphomannomutase